MSAPQPPPMFPKACKHKKAIETWKFRFTPMFSQAMKHEKPTNVRLGNPSYDDEVGSGEGDRDRMKNSIF